MNKRSFLLVLLNLALCLPVLAADRINITDFPYNAVPDEATPGTNCNTNPGARGCNDTTAINNAINAAANGAKSIYFPAGTYRYTGSITLPANTTFRLYGDGPGVSTILFTGNPNAGIFGPNIGTKMLNVEGLTLKANSKNCGTGIYALFSESPTSQKVRSATIENVQIIGENRTAATGGYWTGGIYLNQAQNAVIDKVEINGNNRSCLPEFPTGDCSSTQVDGPPTQFGIFWDSSTPGYRTTGLQVSNTEIHFCNSALKTNGLVAGVFVTGFEFVLCGQHGMPAVDLYSSDPNLGSTFHVVNGHINGLQHGLRFTNLRGVKVSKVFFIHSSGHQWALSGDDVTLNNCIDGVVSQCSFEGVGSDIATETGILLNNSHSVRVEGNYFRHMLPGISGSCIGVLSNSSEIRITDNIFQNGATGDGVRQPPIIDGNPGDTYLRGNNWP